MSGFRNVPIILTYYAHFRLFDVNFWFHDILFAPFVTLIGSYVMLANEIWQF